MFTLNQIIPFNDKLDSDKYVELFGNVPPSLKKYNWLSDHQDEEEKPEEDERLPILPCYNVMGHLYHNKINSRFTFHMMVSRTYNFDTQRDPEFIFDDTYTIGLDSSVTKPNSIESFLVIFSFFKKLMAIALSDVKIFQPAFLNITGHEGFVFGYDPSTLVSSDYTHKANNLTKKFRKQNKHINIESYYDCIVNKLFNRIFDYDNKDNPNLEIFDRIEYFKCYRSPFCDNVEKFKNIRFSDTGIIRYQGLDNFHFKDTKRKGKCKTCINITDTGNPTLYGIPNIYEAKMKGLNRNRNMDLYLDLITYYINNNFDVEKTLHEYEYTRRKIIRRNPDGTMPNLNGYYSVTYEDSDVCPYLNEPRVNGWSHTISYLYNHRIELSAFNFKKILYESSSVPIIAYTDSSKTKIDKEWLISQNPEYIYPKHKLGLYTFKSRIPKFEEESAQGLRMELFSYSERVKMIIYREQVLELYNKIFEDNPFLDQETIFKMIDERIPQPRFFNPKDCFDIPLRGPIIS